MDPLRWKRIGELFAKARPLNSDQRQAFLVENCSQDPDLLEEVVSLLKLDDVSGLLDFRPAASALNIHQIIADRFRIIRHIAEGGMGSVYEAEDLRLNDRVALKMIRMEVASDSTALERFRQEVLYGKRITHPNVCRVHDLGVGHLEDGTEFLFLTMQFLDGETLASRIKRGPMPETDALPLLQDMAEALSAAHQAGIVHRDFKSGNVMVVSRANRDRAVVTDFGLARGSQDDRTLTNGGIVGTLDYMAPEQIRSQNVSPATDIYALGVVMYEMVTGKRPFTADSIVEVALKHLNEEPTPPCKLVPGLSALWNDAILVCLRKEPLERFQSAVEVKAALTGIATRSTIPIRHRSTRRIAPIGLIWIMASILGLASVSSFLVYRHRTSQPTVLERSVAVLPFQESGDTPESFSFGFTEEVMNALGRVPDLHLIGPESSLRFKASSMSAMEIGRTLGARYLLIGSVHHIDHQVHVVVRNGGYEGRLSNLVARDVEGRTRHSSFARRHSSNPFKRIRYWPRPQCALWTVRRCGWFDCA